MVNAEADEFLRCSAFGSLWINRAAASIGASYFQINSMLQQLELMASLGFRPETVGPATEAVNAILATLPLVS